MGDRYIIDVVCDNCKRTNKDVYFAPTCGFSDFVCECGTEIDLEKYTGISYEDASNVDIIQEIVDEVSAKYEKEGK